MRRRRAGSWARIERDHGGRVSRGARDSSAPWGFRCCAGDDLTQKEADSGKPGAVVINETLARRMWPGEDPIGKRLALRARKTMSEIVGVVKDGKYHTLGEAPDAVVFAGSCRLRERW